MLSERLREFGFDQLSEKDMKEILEALEVREGIETLLKHSRTLSLSFSRDASGEEVVVKTWESMKRYKGQTLHAAIRAAVEALKGTG